MLSHTSRSLLYISRGMKTIDNTTNERWPYSAHEVGKRPTSEDHLLVRKENPPSQPWLYSAQYRGKLKGEQSTSSYFTHRYDMLHGTAVIFRVCILCLADSMRIVAIA